MRNGKIAIVVEIDQFKRMYQCLILFPRSHSFTQQALFLPLEFFNHCSLSLSRFHSDHIMTTKRDPASRARKNMRTASNPPMLYNIHYPNSRRGMYSLRAPYNSSYYNDKPTHLPPLTSTAVRPEYLHVEQRRSSLLPSKRASHINSFSGAIRSAYLSSGASAGCSSSMLYPIVRH